MRLLRICEERGSGLDRVIDAAEVHQLAAPEFRIDSVLTTVIVSGPRHFDVMDRNERVRACYQHCVLRILSGGYMTNTSLRERFQLPASKSMTVCQVISLTEEAGLNRRDESIGASKKLARYLPFWS
jgi:ATP-dependent DNA helicase RecG